MTDLGRLAHILRNTAVRDLIRALERDGFSLDRAGATGARIYRHIDGRRVVIHYHHGGDTLTPPYDGRGGTRKTTLRVAGL